MVLELLVSWELLCTHAMYSYAMHLCVYLNMLLSPSLGVSKVVKAIWSLINQIPAYLLMFPCLCVRSIKAN